MVVTLPLCTNTCHKYMSIFPVDSILDILFVLYVVEVSRARVRVRKVMCVAAYTQYTHRLELVLYI